MAATFGCPNCFAHLFRNACAFIFCIGTIVLLTISCSHALEDGDVEVYNPTEPPELQFCTFFNNRAPEVQPDLKNCTWFRDNSCCRQIEIDVTFRKMKSLPGASEQCLRSINYLMCYICSPDQHRFYLQQGLTVCEEFCDNILEHCSTAMLKGRKIGDLYSTGREFCISRRLYVERLDTGRCFNFNKSLDTTLVSAASPRDAVSYHGFMMLLVSSATVVLFGQISLP